MHLEIASLLGTSPDITTPSRTILSCSSDKCTLGFSNFNKFHNIGSYLCPWMDCSGCRNRGVCVVIVTKNISCTKWRLVLVSSEICRCDKLTWCKSRIFSQNNDGNLLPLTYKPPRLFTPRLTTGNITSLLSYTSTNFIQTLLKCEGSAAGYSNLPLFNEALSKDIWRAFFHTRKYSNSTPSTLNRYIYECQSCTTLFF